MLLQQNEFIKVTQWVTREEIIISSMATHSLCFPPPKDAKRSCLSPAGKRSAAALLLPFALAVGPKEQTAFGGDLVDTVSHLEIAAPR
jgi:hypothetical protein